ncbi:helix-turn-helix domain-containing protein [Thauera propionica]|uniref:helix-turn-helix domain-containing protein n=1 Tax=Thauera propionica TaxID=2019431 RepID=UPI0023F438C1|nr:helix-turn-helix transcriptional regulator [Thauera propionica]MDD3675810.1 helix-turn-helix transcriptional regulator [Thauera propionica]
MTKIKAARKAKGLTVQDVATRCGITPGTVSRIERGLIGTSPETAKKLAAALGIDPADVIFVERAA